jgi:hypothetical protein
MVVKVIWDAQVVAVPMGRERECWFGLQSGSFPLLILLKYSFGLNVFKLLSCRYTADVIVCSCCHLIKTCFFFKRAH